MAHSKLRDPYNRIMAAAKAGRGVRLSAEEVRDLSYDDAIATHALHLELGEPDPDPSYRVVEKKGASQ